MTADYHHHPKELAPVEARVAAIESVLAEKGILDVEAVDEIVRHFEDNLGPMNGAKVVARAWTDPAYRERLLAEGTAAVKELGFEGPEGNHIVVVENTPTIHNLVVCTLCSCYPWPILGLPPKNGTKHRLTAHAPCASRASCSPSWGPILATTSRSASCSSDRPFDPSGRIGSTR